MRINLFFTWLRYNQITHLLKNYIKNATDRLNYNDNKFWD